VKIRGMDCLSLHLSPNHHHIPPPQPSFNHPLTWLQAHKPLAVQNNPPSPPTKSHHALLLPRHHPYLTDPTPPTRPVPQHPQSHAAPHLRQNVLRRHERISPNHLLNHLDQNLHLFPPKILLPATQIRAPLCSESR